MYQKVSTDLNFVEREKKIEAFWQERHIFEKSIDSRSKADPYIFTTDPRPRTANRISAMC